MDDKTEKVALFRYGLIAPLVLETLPRGELTRRAQQIAARLYDIPHSARRPPPPPPLRHPPSRPPSGLGGHATGLDAALSPQRPGRAVSPTTPGSRASPCRRAGSRYPHRTAQAREAASYGGRSAARVGRGRRAEPCRPVGFHTLSFPARPRAYRTPTVTRQSHRA